MSIRKPLLVLLALLPLLVTGSACGRSGSTTGTSAKPVIAVIPKGTTHEYWKSVHAGAVKAARDHGADIIWKGPIREDDRDEQVKVVETFLAQKIDGIVIAPLDDRALAPVLKDAAARHIPVVVIDSDVKWDGYLSFVATDNEKAGGLAAERLGEVLGGKGKVVMMRYQEGSASTMAREAGFLSTLAAKFPNIKVVSDNQYGGATTETAYATAESLLATYADVDGIFCPNESTAFGMLLAIQAAGRAGKIHLVGFDASDKLIEGLRQGNIDGLVVQNPFRMGETGVNFLLQSLKGETVPRRLDTGATMVTRENMDQPEIKLLLQPDLATYLN